MARIDLEAELAALATLSPAQLRGEWLQTFRSAAPPVGHRLLALGKRTAKEWSLTAVWLRVSLSSPTIAAPAPRARSNPRRTASAFP